MTCCATGCGWCTDDWTHTVAGGLFAVGGCSRDTPGDLGRGPQFARALRACRFRNELAQMETMAEQGLVEIEPGALQVTRMGWYFVRAVAMVFDRHLQADRQRERFSRII